MDRISALMDGELDAHQTGQQFARLKQDVQARACWDTFHLIGDAMRGERGVAPGFAARFSERLAQEPTVLAPRRKPASRVMAYALSAAASLAAIALVGWVAINGMVEPQPAPRDVIAKKAQPPDPAPAQLVNLPSDGRMNEYILAHQEYSPSTAIQGLAPYIRTVSARQSQVRE
jgi:sigma-E factor negative regulatory protein RseA